MLNNIGKWTTFGILTVAAAGCATTPESSDKLVALEYQYNTLIQRGFVEEYAPVALQEAKESVANVKRLEEQGVKKAKIEHYQYLAQSKLDRALEVAKQKRAEEYIANSGSKRKDVLLAAKENAVDAAETKAQVMQIRAELAESEAASAHKKMEDMAQKANELTQTLENITAQESERGLVLTMGSILFEVDEASLKPEAERTLERIAEFLAEYPNRDILVEGFTDNTGAQEYNLQLSERRAKSVVALLKNHGIDSERLTAKGYGESYPVTTNNTQVGRQKNRRVELVIAEDDKSEVTARE